MKIALMAGHAYESEGAEMCAGYYEGFGEHSLARHYLPGVRENLGAFGHEVVLTHRRTEEPDMLQSKGLQRVGHKLASEQ